MRMLKMKELIRAIMVLALADGDLFKCLKDCLRQQFLHSSMIKLLGTGILLFMMVGLVLAEFQLKETLTGTFPKGFYKYNLTTGNVIEVTLIGGASTTDLGCQLLASGAAFTVSGANYEANCAVSGDDLVLTHTITSDDQYTVCVYIGGSANNFISIYYIQIKVNGTEVEKSKDALTAYGDYDMIFILNTDQACTAKWVYSGPSTFMEVYAAGTTTYDYNSAFATYGNTRSTSIELSFSPNAVGDWYITFQLDGTSGSYTIQYFTDSDSPCGSFCMLVDNAASVDPDDSTSCICNSGFEFNADDGTCDTVAGTGLNCSTVSHAEGADGQDACKCKDGYSWNYDKKSCDKDHTLAIALGVAGGVIGVAAVAAIVVLVVKKSAVVSASAVGVSNASNSIALQAEKALPHESSSIIT